MAAPRPAVIHVRKAHMRAIERVLKLVDAYLEVQPQETLTSGAGGLMTWGELRQHVQGAKELARKALES